MPLSAGPTRFAPFTQQYQKGYAAFNLPQYVEYLEPRMSQMELRKGDAVFFNPATFHQPGENTLDEPRIANLLQVSAGWGRPMEANDRMKMTKSVWPEIKRWAEGAKHAEGKGDGANGSGGANGHTSNGHESNSHESNGHGSNGLANGHGANGDASYGTATNGTKVNGHAKSDISSKHSLQLEALIAATCDDYGYPKRMDNPLVSPSSS